MTGGGVKRRSARAASADLQVALWRLLGASDREDATAFLALLD